MPLTMLKEFLDCRNIKYVVISHSRAHTAQEVAASAHIKGKEMAKTVIMKIDGKMAMFVLPASHRIDNKKFTELLNIKEMELAGEFEFKTKFPGCEAGAMPPFGNLFGMDTYVSFALKEDKEIAFNAGSYTELVRMSMTDYNELVNPVYVDFSSKYKS